MIALGRAVMVQMSACGHTKASPIIRSQLKLSRVGSCHSTDDAASNKLRPDLLVIGIHGRSGLLKVLLGSVTEEALRSLNVDILAVPPLKREYTLSSVQD